MLYQYGSCTTASAACTCVVDREVDLYEVYYSMSGNTVIDSTRVIDQVHPNICLNPSTFTGRI